LWKRQDVKRNKEPGLCGNIIRGKTNAFQEHSSPALQAGSSGKVNHLIQN
jgi:hypothetical protein